jgi:chitin synthase
MFKNNENIAGCCGEIVPVIKNKWNFVEQAQKVEYKLSHIFDKAMESLFGYVSVLPGAFSAYRFKCLNRDEIFDAYFYTEYTKRISMFDANMYLAEDRILCLGLVCLSGEKFILKYVSESRAETDVPDEVYSLMVQRRRWNNGAWFSSIYTILNWTRICKSGHSILRKLCFIILMMYYVLVAIFSWVLVGGFYLCFSISLKKNLGEDNNDLNKLEKFSTPIIIFYVSTLIALGICSLSSKPQEIKSFLNLISLIYGLFTVATIVLTCLFIFKSGFSIESDKLRESTSILMLSFLLLLIILTIFMNGFKTLKSVMSGFIQFLFLSGTYVNIFLIYSICNIHDVSWGNRPGGEATEDEQKISFEKQRITWLTVWIISNISFAYFLNWLSGNDDENAIKFILYFGWLTCGIIFVKVLAGIIYILAKCECIKHQTTPSIN